MNPKYLLVLIIIVGLFLRLYRLEIDIPSLYGDEAAGQYKMWIMLHNLDNNSLVNWHWWQSQIYRIFTFTWFLGLTPLAVRLPSALAGALLPLATFLASYQLSKKVQEPERKLSPLHISLICGTLTALLPWSFHLSRIGYAQVTWMLIMVCLHIWLYLIKPNFLYTLISLIPLLLAAYFYPTMIVIFPLISLALVLQNLLRSSSFKNRLSILITLTILIITAALILLFPYRSTIHDRGLDLAIWGNVNVTADMNLYRGTANHATSLFPIELLSPNRISKFFYNYPLAVTSEFTERYLSFYNPEWLFLKGDPVLRHSTGQMGVFWPILMPFLLLGIYTFFNESNLKNKIFVSLWILISPVPAAITHDGGGYLLRVATLLLFFTYFCSLGIVKAFCIIRPQFWRYVYLLSLAGLCLYSTLYFFFGYFYVYPTLSAQSYEYGFKELALFQQAHQDQSMLIIWQGYYPDGYFRFWQQTTPRDFKNFQFTSQTYGQTELYQTFPNLFFSWPANSTDLESILNTIKPSYIVFPSNYLKSNPEYQNMVNESVAQIDYPDGSTAFTIFRL